MDLVVILGLQRELSLCCLGTPVVQTRGNFPASATSWYEYFNFSMHPKSVGVVFTPSGMHRSMIVASIVCMGTMPWVVFPFLLVAGLRSPPPSVSFPHQILADQ
jgi:hypothetical protein